MFVLLLPEKVQLQKSEVKCTAFVAGCENEIRHETKKRGGVEKYIFIVVRQLPDKGVKGWCISWFKGMVIPVFTSVGKKDEA